MEQITGVVWTAAIVFIALLVVAALAMVINSRKEKAKRRAEYDEMRRPGREAERKNRERR